MSDSLKPHGLYSPWNSLGQNTGVGSLSLFQGIFPTLFILFTVFSRQEYGNGWPFSSSVDPTFSELSAMTHLSWLALQGMAHSFTELVKAVVHVIRLISFL